MSSPPDVLLDFFVNFGLVFFISGRASKWRTFHDSFLCLAFQDTEAQEEEKKSKNVLKKIAKRVEGQKLDSHLEDQFASGRLLACISSRPGQCGRSDGYVQSKAF